MCDTRVSTVVASTASLERGFQSLMVQGKKKPPLYCVLAVMRLSCRHVRGSWRVQLHTVAVRILFESLRQKLTPGEKSLVVLVSQVPWFSVFFFFCVVCNFNIMKTLTLLVQAGLCWCFHNPSNSDMDYRILNVCMWSLHAYIHWGSWLIVSCEGLLWSLHRIWFQRNLRAGAKPST